MNLRKHTLIEGFVIAMMLMMQTSVMRAQTISQQTISDIAKSDPLIITGAVGTQNTYRYSSSGNTYGSPLSNTVYANLNIGVYGFTMPFSFYYSNDNTSFSFPHFTFNLNPSYKNWHGHIGQSTMAFSNYVMNMSFNGVGVEYTTDKLRFGAFYGKLRSAVNDDPTDPAARKPQFRRMGWGFKAGYGTGKNYIDLYILRAYDCLNTVTESWREVISPQENIVIGLKGNVTPVKWASLSANVATSIFSSDTQADKINVSEARKWDKVFDVRYSSLMRFAGDAALNFRLPGFNANINYRMVQPDYTSLGTYYMSNNYQSIGVNVSTNLLRSVSLSANFNGQEDNLTNNQMYTTRGFVYAANASWRRGSSFSVSATYNGYTQKQSDGTAHVNDTTRVNRQMSSFSLSPTYVMDTELFGHVLSLSANVTHNKDRNPYSTGQTDVTTKALGVNYSCDVKPWDVTLNVAYSRQQSEGYKQKYTSDIVSVGASRSFLKQQNLNVSANCNLCYNEIKKQSKSLSMGADVSVGYTVEKVHNFSASANFNRYGDVNITNTHSNLDAMDITCSLNYAYTFSLVEIKRKAKDKDVVR